MTVKISENQLVNGHASALKNELEHSRKVSEETSERLATTAYDLENLVKIKVKSKLTQLGRSVQVSSNNFFSNVVSNHGCLSHCFDPGCQRRVLLY